MQRVRARQAPYGSLGQPWTMPWGPGTNLSGLFDLYPSRGDVTLAADLATAMDGPMQVFRYGALTINTARTVTNRCRGAIILCDSLTMGAAGSFSMTARGAAGNATWANQDIVIPSSMRFTGKNTDRAGFLSWLASTGYCIFDPTLFACPPPGMGDIVADYTAWPARGTAIISAAGCGVRKQCSYEAALAGSAGTNAPGGGGTAGYYSAWSAPGRVWGGGPGSGCMVPTQSDFALIADQYGGQGGTGYLTGTNACGGGGAGNPGGPGNTQGAYVGQAGADGTGGILIVICRGLLTLSAGHSFVSNGSNGGAATSYNNNGGGAGSGAGLVGVWYGSKNTTDISMSANGGAGGSGNFPGAAGGPGSTRSGLLPSMGWV